MLDDDILGLRERYSSLYDQVQEFDRDKSFWWVGAKKLQKSIGALEQIAQPEASYSNLRTNVMDIAREKGVYDNIPSLSERFKERIKDPLKIAKILAIASIPLSSLYYYFKYPGPKLTRKQKTEAILGETAKLLGASLIVYTCFFGAPSIEDYQKPETPKKPIPVKIYNNSSDQLS